RRPAPAASPNAGPWRASNSICGWARKYALVRPSGGRTMAPSRQSGSRHEEPRRRRAGRARRFRRLADPGRTGPAGGDLGRLVPGAAVLLPFLWAQRASFPAARWPRLVLVGAINSAVPFVLFAWAAQRAPAGVGAITNAMAVLCTALVAWLFFRERIPLRKW